MEKKSGKTMRFMGTILEEEEGDHGDSGSGATSRASVKLIHQVISGFDDEKRRLAAQTGLKGILKFPEIIKLNNKFSVWLLSHVDVKERAIVINQNKIFKITASDVNKVFDISSEGTSVMDRNLDRSEATINLIRGRLGMDAKDGRSLKAAQAILEKEYVYPLSDSEVDAFKTAFVVFVMGRFLSPRAKNDYSSIDFWPALIDPSSLASFNWAEYVVEEIFEAATKLKADIRRKKASPNITGCPLFLQVRYLDSLDLGLLTMPQDITPRISVFSQEILKAMIVADTVKGRGNVAFGAAKPRDASQCFYSKVNNQDVANFTTTDGAFEFFLNDHAVKLLAEIKAAVQTEGGKTSAQVVSRTRLNRSPSSKSELRIVSQITMAHDHGSQCTGIDLNMSALGEQGSSCLDNSRGECSGSMEMDIFRIYKKSRTTQGAADGSGNGRSSVSAICGRSLQLGQPSSDARVAEHSLDKDSADKSIQSDDNTWADAPSFDLGLDFVDDVPSPSKNTMTTPKKQVFSFIPPNWYIGENTLNASPTKRNKILQECYMFERDTRFTDKINLNAKTLDFDESYSPFLKRKARIINRADVHTTTIVPLKYSEDICLEFYNWVSGVDAGETVESVWIMHHVPRYIELSGAEIIRQFCRDHDMDHDIFNVLTRRLTQAEDDNLDGIRSKHYMESDFLTCILAGSKPSTYISIRNQFIGSHITYDVPSCKLIFFTGLIDFAWVSYVADLIENKLTIYDPTMTEDTDHKTKELHLQICDQLKAGIAECANELFEGWDYNWDNLTTVFHKNDMKLQHRHHTGLHTINFCKYFDGEVVRRDSHNTSDEKLAHYYLYDLMHLKGNSGFIPRQFVQTVDA